MLQIDKAVKKPSVTIETSVVTSVNSDEYTHYIIVK